MPILVGIVMLLPVLAGLLATLLPAFSYLPAIGAAHVSLDAWRALLAWPGLVRSLALTACTGIAATSLSLTAALAIACVARRFVPAMIAPVLAVPHAALAIGLAFLIAPSGWVARAISPWLTGWTAPPDLPTVQDPWGVALIAGLWLKETPYLLLMTLAALAQADVTASLRVAASLGYGRWRAWTLVVLPRVWPQLRLPVMAVLAFSLSVVDVALVLGPGNPPTLAIQGLRWLTDPDLANWPTGCAAAVMLAALVGVSVVILCGVERRVAAIGRHMIAGGRRGGSGWIADTVAGVLFGLLVAASLGALAVLGVWSVTSVWRFPDALPTAWTLATWRAQSGGLGGPASATLELGAAATAAALVLAIAWLQGGRATPAFLYVPLLMPQIAFLFGIQIGLVRLALDGTWLALLWVHVVFVLPYVFLALADPWRALDPRYARTALSLGVPPWRVLLRVTLPLLARPILAAAAVGFAVSAGLYLPTLFAGAGRVATLTTEAVTLASGGDRRVLAVTAVAQAAMPLLVYVLAVAVPALRARRRRGLAITP